MNLEFFRHVWVYIPCQLFWLLHTRVCTPRLICDTDAAREWMRKQRAERHVL